MKNIYHSFYLFVIILLIITIIIYYKNSRQVTVFPVKTEKIVRDTIIIKEPREPIFITKVKPLIKYQYDTIYTSFPFVAEIDTIIKTDTIFLRYEFPENLFSMAIKFPPDSLILREITINKSVYKDKEWWEIPLYIASGATLGFIIGMSINIGGSK